MAQSKKNKKQNPKNAKKRMSTNQKVMVVIGVFIIIAMLLPSLLYLLN